MEPSVVSWPLWLRIWILLNVSFYNLLGNAFAAGAPPLFSRIIQELNCTSEEASQLSTYVLLTLGLSNVFALPAASLIGKRYTILASLVLFFVFCLWSAEASTFADLRASRILGGLAGGLVEALGPSFVAESFPEQQLASAMVVYVGLLAAGSAIGPIVAGVVAEGLGDWRWYFRILSAMIFVTFFGSLIMLPETRVEVSREAEVELSTITEDSPKGQLPSPTCTEIETANGRSGALSRRTSLGQQWRLRSFSMAYVDMDWKLAASSLIHPIQLLVAPQVLITTFIFGLTIGWTVLVSILVSVVYSPPPFLWGARAIGLLSIGPLVGLLVGLPVGGALADYLFNRATRRNGGISDPASRLPAVAIGGLISPAGCLVIGYGLQSPDKWAQVSIGYGMVATGLTCSANILLTYAVDTMPPRASHIGVLVNLIKNSVGFGVSYAATSWMAQVGPVAQFGTMAGILWGVYLLVIPLYLFSDTIIRKTSVLA
ncbi:Major facilitator superfamily transporter [Colletotrichum higginsianum IMI 349063]|uniref:Major facilitator superfamily transporter n=2 Tax=Colletotrichum higginsianum TaxID=80884 RepID=A0A1B7YG87_COLHI|nr:Major facilitator superfamily transporter [Colletotrichum higginsianum IMI 349063]OBR11181.1 Major facilitator superfamily transporter [Colletotrichum higginsianum IMI 349063]TIC90825.1 putative MFS-type transporter [Colletotrichum higginsianum]